MPSNRVAVLGGTGFAGSATVDALVAMECSVRAIARHIQPHRSPLVESVSVDITRLDDLIAALAGTRVAILCARPDYWKWTTELLPMFQTVLAAAMRTGVGLVLCDNVYAYGVVDGPITETTPYRPIGAKGRVRQAAAEVLLAAHERGDVPVAIGRAADFFGPAVTLPPQQQLFGAAIQGKVVRAMGTGDEPHSTSFIDDVGRGLAMIATHADAFGHVWHLPTVEPITELEFAERVVRGAGSASRVARTPWWVLRAMCAVGGLVSPVLRELPEVFYQHQRPFVVDASRFENRFGVRATPVDDAIARTLEWWRRREDIGGGRVKAPPRGGS